MGPLASNSRNTLSGEPARVALRQLGQFPGKEVVELFSRGAHSLLVIRAKAVEMN
jgi:hypothetical protein